MNNVIKKMAQYEQRVIESKLASHNVHLAITDDMVKLTAAIEKNYLEFRTAKKQLKDAAATLYDLGNTMMKDADALDSLNGKFEAMAKDLGINPDNSDVYSAATDVQWDMNDVEDTFSAINNIK